MRVRLSRLRSALLAPLLAVALGLTATLGLPAAVLAQDGHEGHNHGGDGPTTPIPVNPRGVAETPAFQLAAMMVRNQLLVFVDNPDTNAPVNDAAIEMTVGDRTVTLSPRGEGAYVAEGWRPNVGHNALMFFVDAAGTADLLSVSIDIPDPRTAAAEAPATPATGGLRGKVALLVAVPVALLLGLLVSVLVTRTVRRRRSRADEDGSPLPAGPLADTVQI